jgi:hypothetical protein
MATQTTEITQTEALTPTIPVTAQTLPERPVTQSEVQLEDTKGPLKAQASESTQTKPKIRRIIDEEGGNSTASVRFMPQL